MPTSSSIACFISPHGLGHAARAAAILAALQQRAPHLRLEMFTLAPPGFFLASGCRQATFHAECTDIGFAQKSALVEDIPETLRLLDELLPFREPFVGRLAATIQQARCTSVLCDISPLGIAVAQAAHLPSVLIESFTWDDLYRHYAAGYPRLGDHAAALRQWFSAADVHIQTDPACRPVASASFTSAPVSRPPKTAREAIRRELGVLPGQRLVLITMGGVSERTPLLAHLAHRRDLVFVVAWGADHMHRTGNVICLPLQSTFYHPDLIHAADAVVGKAGYSTMTEVQQAGVPFGYVPRLDYPETPSLVRFIEAHLSSIALENANLGEGVPADFIDRLLALPRRQPPAVNGADQIADFLLHHPGGVIPAV